MEYEINSRKGIDFRELLRYKELFFFFTWRDIKVKYKQTVLGFTWVVLQPLIMMAIFTVFFGNMMHVPSDGVPYAVFAFSGLLYWNLFSSGVTNAGNSMVFNANIIKKIYFPRIIIPISCILVSFFDFLITLLLFLLLLLYFNISFISIHFIVYQFIALTLTLLTSIGMGSLLSALNVKFRDFKYIIPFFIQTLLFLTPVIYPVSIVKFPWAKIILELNPMFAPIEFSRASLSVYSFPIESIALSLVSIFVISILGMVYFRNTEYYFADLV